MIAWSVEECISLSVPSAARVMIAQWENERISLSALSAARVTIVQWENECISLSVLSVARVQLPAVAKYLKTLFPSWSHTLREEMGAAKSSQAHWRDTRNKSFFCPQVPPTINLVMGLNNTPNYYSLYGVMELPTWLTERPFCDLNPQLTARKSCNLTTKPWLFPAWLLFALEIEAGVLCTRCLECDVPTAWSAMYPLPRVLCTRCLECYVPAARIRCQDPLSGIVPPLSPASKAKTPVHSTR